MKPPASGKPSQIAPVYYEKYYDTANKRYYFYNPAECVSVWEVPPGSIVADMTLN